MIHSVATLQLQMMNTIETSIAVLTSHSNQGDLSLDTYRGFRSSVYSNNSIRALADVKKKYSLLRSQVIPLSEQQCREFAQELQRFMTLAYVSL